MLQSSEFPAYSNDAISQINAELVKDRTRIMTFSSAAVGEARSLEAAYLAAVGKLAVYLARQEGSLTVDPRHLARAAALLSAHSRSDLVASVCLGIGGTAAGVGATIAYSLSSEAGPADTMDVAFAAGTGLPGLILLTVGVVLAWTRVKRGR